MKSATLFDQIHELIDYHVRITAQQNKLNLGNRAIFSENLFGRVFNVITHSNLINANDGTSNVESIDLWDESKKWVVQVTTREKGFKKKKEETVSGFLNNPAYKDFSSLIILFVGPNDVGPAYRKREDIRPGCSYEGIDITRLLSKIRNADLSAMEKILGILLKEKEDNGNRKIIARIDLVALKQKLQSNLEQFIQLKYFSNTHKSVAPLFGNRKVKRHNREIIFDEKELNVTDNKQVRKMEVVVGDFASLIRSDQPSFLFGELGSGKSTIVSRYLYVENEQAASLNFLIPANYIKGKIGESPDTILQLVSRFLKDYLITVEEIDIRLLLDEYPITIAFDGLDELPPGDVTLLLKHLQIIYGNFSGLTIIATGRPIELRPLIQLREWNCLSVIDLSLQEVRELLINEAMSAGLNKQSAILDTQQRLAFLKARSDLMSLAVTPLVVTLIRDHLKSDAVGLSLGDLLYKVLKERLSWEAVDQPSGSNAFFTTYPLIPQREKFIAQIAKGISESKENTIQDEQLFRIADQFVDAAAGDRAKVVSDGIAFLKKAFLQQMDNKYAFVSQPLFDTCLAMQIADNYNQIVIDASYINLHWRAISGAASIIRARNEVNQARSWFKGVLDTFLTMNDHTTISAIITQELNDVDLAGHYIDLVAALGYRPLRIWATGTNDWDDPDTFSPVAIAYTIAIAGDKGFDWLFNEYLSLRHYIHTNETSLNSTILLHYLIKKEFTLSEKPLSQLAALLPYHLRFATFSCSNFVPVLALILPEALDLRERCLALVVMLSQYPAYDRARILINELCDKGNQKEIIEAIETLAAEGQYQKAEIISLWYELNTVSEINFFVLKATIKVLLGSSEDSRKEIVFERFGRDNFVRFLKYTALEHGEDADEAALLLHELTEDVSFYLIGRPIMLSSKWHHGSDHLRNLIMQKVIYTNPKVINQAIIENLVVRKGETPLLGFMYFVKALLMLPEDYGQRFTYAINFLPKYAITRNPELRDDLQKLFLLKPIYRKVLTDATLHLDTVLRENAVKITIACLPDDCSAELEIYLSGLLQPFALDEEEWLGFLYKLNFSAAVLDHIYHKAKGYYVVGRTLALALLFHRDFPLTTEDIFEMVRGLLGKGTFIDRTERGLQSKRIIENARLLPYILKLLYEDTADDYDSASSVLQSYFMEKLSEQDRAYVLALQLERHHYYLFEFDNEHLESLSDARAGVTFEKACLKVRSLLNIPEAFAEIYLRAIYGDKASWVRLFEKMLYEREHYQEYVLFHFYRWAIAKRKTRPDLTALAGQVALEMLDYPAFRQQGNGNSPVVHLAIVVDEFSQLPKEKMEQILATMEAKEDLLAVAAYRLGYIPINVSTRRDASYLPLFKAHRPLFLPKIKPETAREWLFKTDELPANFDLFIKAVILYDVYENEPLMLKDASGLGAFLLAIIQFLKDGTANFDTLLDSAEAMQCLRSDKHFGELIRLLKEISLAKPNGRSAYIASLEKKISTNKKVFLAEVGVYFQELIALNEPFSFEMLTTLLSLLIDRAYLLDEHLSNDLAYYTCRVLPREQYPKLAEYLRLHINALTNSTGQAHREDHLHVCWLYSLMLLFILQKNDEIGDLGFLFGLKSLFIQNSRRAYHTHDPNQRVQFKGRELLICSDIILSAIPQKVIDEVIRKGLNVKMPEINALCRFFRAFSSRGTLSY